MNLLASILYIVGLVIAVQGWRWSKKRGYCLFIVYFALALYSATAAPRVNRWIKHRFERKPDPVIAEKKIEMQQELQKVRDRYDLPPEALVTTIRFPLGQLLLVLGLWMIAGKERAPNQAIEAIGDPASPQPHG